MAKRKYAEVVKNLPKLSIIDPDRKDLVAAVIRQIKEPGTGKEKVVDVLGSLDIIKEELAAIYQYELRATKDKPWASEYARVYAELRAVKKLVESYIGDIGLLIEAYSALMVDQFEVEGIEKLTLANGQPVSTWSDPHGTVTDKEKFRQWCITEGLEKSLALPWPTFNSLVKERALAGEPEPEGAKVWAKAKIRLGNE